ncbi:MAG: peptidyl-prolyl cis-trans isomerase [Muribaculaceae bacterium]|nr:peptidyl-prolyl cis-trans isomerase [Muribaculaceae bacterium]
MKKHFLPAALIAAAILGATAAAPAGDPVVMTINGKDISRSEFEYLYNKNNLQQEKPQSIDEYLDMFVVYKLKVADAEAAGIDTTASFIKELDGYCADISTPYLTDTLVREKLINDAWLHMQTLRNVSHIMLPMGDNQAERDANRQKLDSIRSAILAGADFAEMAKTYSYDRSALQNGGSMGWFTTGRFPYPFEKASYETAVGQISDVIDDRPYGWHIIRVNDEKPNPGSVHASHILKLTQNMSPEEVAAQKARIDSIYTLLQNGADFAELAKAESEDPGSKQNGGDLGLFGAGVMVPEFEEAAFATPVGQFSEPFQSPFGYHIVLVTERKPLGTLAEHRGMILSSMMRDNRKNMPREARIAELQKKWGFSIDNEGLAKVRLAMADKKNAEAFDAVDPSTVICSTPDGSVKAAQVLAEIPASTREKDRDPFGTFERQANDLLTQLTIRYGRTEFAKENPEYRNLVNEYRDGILLFEISNRNIWDRANKDADALEAYFKAHRDKYTTWDKPRFKGYVVLATSDSIASAAKGYLASHTVERDSLVKTMRNEFGQDVKVEHVLTAKGDNKIVDEIAFQGEKADPVGKWAAWFPYDYKVIDQPEEAADVKAAVSSDLQQELEQAWVQDLKKKYKVKLNKKELKKLYTEK